MKRLLFFVFPFLLILGACGAADSNPCESLTYAFFNVKECK